MDYKEFLHKSKITKSEIYQLYHNDPEFSSWYDQCKTQYGSYFVQKGYSEPDRMLLSLNSLLYQRPIQDICPVCGAKLFGKKFCSRSCSNRSLGRDQSSLATKINKKCSEMMIGNESIASIKAKRSFQSRWKNGMIQSESLPQHSGRHGHIKGWLEGIPYYSALEYDVVQQCLANNQAITLGSYVEYELNGVSHNYYFDYFIDGVPCEVKSVYWLKREFNLNLIKFQALLRQYPKMILILGQSWIDLTLDTVEVKLRELLGTP